MSPAFKTPISSGSNAELVRLPGWEARLACVIAAAAHRPYKYGENDCFRFACEAIEAVSGVDLWAPWRGRYSTKLRALRHLAQFGGDFTRSFSRLFQVEPVPATFARRGDIAEYVDPDRGQHLGVVQGAHVAIRMTAGIGFVALRNCVHAWRIG